MARSKSGSQRKRHKRTFKNKTAPRREPTVTHKRPTATANGELIQNLMDARNVKGDYRDYVMITGSRLVDWISSWDIFNAAGEPMGVEGVALIHKSRLDKIIDPNFASKFWDKKLKRRVPPTQSERNPNVIRHTTQ